MEYRVRQSVQFSTVFIRKESVDLYSPTPMGVEELQRRIRNGIAFLTKHKGPRWDKGIDLSRLYMQSGCSCIAGQSFKDFCETDDGFHALQEGKAKDPKTGALLPRLSLPELQECGFYTDRHDPLIAGTWLDYNVLYGWLGDVWKAEILDKRRRERRNRITG